MEVKMIPFWAKTPLGKRYDGWLIPKYYWEDFAEAHPELTFVEKFVTGDGETFSVFDLNGEKYFRHYIRWNGDGSLVMKPVIFGEATLRRKIAELNDTLERASSLVDELAAIDLKPGISSLTNTADHSSDTR